MTKKVTWLAGQKAKIDAEQAKQKERENADKARDANWRTGCRARATNFAKAVFDDLVGKKTTFGKFSYKRDEQMLYFYGGDTELGALNFSFDEETKYDSDGCGNGTGHFFDTGHRWFKHNWKDTSDTLHRADNSTFLETSIYSQRELAEYLLYFMK